LIFLFLFVLIPASHKAVEEEEEEEIKKKRREHIQCSRRFVELYGVV
jgi:hypothetical protein